MEKEFWIWRDVPFLSMTLKWCVAEAVREDFIASERFIDDHLVPNARRRGHTESEIKELIEDTRAEKTLRKFDWVKQWEIVQRSFPLLFSTLNDGHNTRIGDYFTLTNPEGSLREEMKKPFLFRIVCREELKEIFFHEIASTLTMLAKENRWSTRRWKLHYLDDTGVVVVERTALDEPEKISPVPWVKATIRGGPI